MLDFNNIVICNNDSDIDALRDTLFYLKSHGVRRFIITRSFDPRNSYYSRMLWELRDFRAAAMKVRPYATTVRVYPALTLSKGILKDPIVKKLSFDGTHIFIEAPLFLTDEWLPADINYLLYKQKLKPIFICFERNLVTSKYDFGNKLYKTRQSLFCLDVNYLTDTDPNFRIRVDQAIFRNIPVIPCISRSFSKYGNNLPRRFESLKKRVGETNYYALCRTLDLNGRNLFQ